MTFVHYFTLERFGIFYLDEFWMKFVENQLRILAFSVIIIDNLVVFGEVL